MPADQQDTAMLEHQCNELELHFARWHEDRASEFGPTTIFSLSHDPSEERIAVGYWPGNIDTYFDLYVAGIWNIFRTARLLLLALLITMSGRSNKSTGCIETANHIVEDIFASIPYHLADNLPVFVERSRHEEAIDPGRTLGGLLLMHPLYAISKCSFLSEESREYARDCLRWIGDEMGIGQAGLMANVSRYLIQSSSNSHDRKELY